MRVLAAAVAVALLFVPSAAAKFRMTLSVLPIRPHVGQLVRVRLTAERPLGADAVMRLAAVAPGAALMDVVARVAGESPSYPAVVRDSFAVRLRRVDASTWRGELRFQRRGSWRLVVPNFGAPGYAMPPPLIRPVAVR